MPREVVCSNFSTFAPAQNGKKNNAKQIAQARGTNNVGGDVVGTV